MRAVGGCARCRAENSFCVALYEALCGRTPHGDGVSTGRILAIDPDDPVPRPGGDVPGWLAIAVMRGLRARPEERFPDMAALLHELTRDRRRSARIGGLLLTGVLGGCLAALLISRAPDPLDICLSGQADIAAVAGEGPAFTRHVDAWREAHVTACHETHRGDVPDTLLARRQSCLAAARGTLAAVVARAPAADRERLIRELPPPANCLDEGLGRIPAPRDQVTRERVARVDGLLAEAYAGRVLGEYAGAADHANRAVVLADAADHPPALARAHHALGAIERRRNRRVAAETPLLAAVAGAGIAGDLVLQVSALHELVRLALLGDRAAENGTQHLQIAARVLSEIHPEVPSAAARALRAEHADMRGLLAYAAGDAPAAITDHTDAITRWRDLGGQMDVRGELAASLLNRARAHAEAKAHTAARDDRREALALEIDRYGADHPSLAANHRGLVHDELVLPDHAAAESEASRALAIDTAHHDPTGVAQDRLLLAQIALETGQLDAAAEHVAALQAALADIPDVAPELRADFEFVAAQVATMQADPGASARWTRASAAFAAVPGAWAACQRAQAEFNRAQLALAADDRVTYAEALRRIDALTPTIGALSCQALAESLWLRGEDHYTHGDVAAALSLFEQAVARSDPTQPNHAYLLDSLARALHTLGRDHARVRRIVDEALRLYHERDNADMATSLRDFMAVSPRKNR